MQLSLLAERFVVCRLAPGAETPSWAWTSFFSITRTRDELSIVCEGSAVPRDVPREAGWRAFKVAGPLDFALTGILASVAAPLAAAGVSIFALSTYDTDYVLVKEHDVDRAVEALESAGHVIEI